MVLLEYPFYVGSNKDRFTALELEVQALLMKRVVEEVTSRSPGFFNYLFLFPVGGWISVLDISKLNNFITLSEFSKEMPKSVLVLI